MLGGSAVGYARMTRRWWTPVQRDARRAGSRDRPLYFVSSNTHSLANLLSGSAREHEDEVVALDRRVPDRRPARRARALPRGAGARARGRTSSTSPRASTSLRSPRRSAERRGAERAVGVRTSRARPRCAVERPGHAARAPRPGALDPRLGDVDAAALAGAAARDRQHRVSARPRRLQHPARDHDATDTPARRLRARQGGDAERRRRRRDDLQRHPRRALAARRTGSTTPSRSTTSRRTSCSDRASTTSARSR